MGLRKVENTGIIHHNHTVIDQLKNKHYFLIVSIKLFEIGVCLHKC